MRVDGRKADELRKLKISRNYIKSAEGSALIEMGHQGHLHRNGRQFRSSLPARERHGLGYCRIRHASPVFVAEDPAGAEQGGRPNARDPAADREVASLCRGHGRARRAHRPDRLRRDPGRRRNADRIDHRSFRRAGRRPPSHQETGSYRNAPGP